MPDIKFPALNPAALEPTRDAIHAYSRVAGGWCKTARKKRKHWWHASLRPSLRGLSTGVIYATTDFEIELDLTSSTINVHTGASSCSEPLTGQSASQLDALLRSVLLGTGVDASPEPPAEADADRGFPDFSADEATRIHRTFASVTGALQAFRAGIREETSPIQVWPHHFDLSMIWLPGPKIPGQDPANEESADKQMNFGFVFGDEGIAEPYFYVTAYPLPDAMAKTKLPTGTAWRSDGFTGAVLLYGDLVRMADPAAYLHDLWSTLVAAGQLHLATDE